MKATHAGGEISLPHLLGGALLAGLLSVVASRFVLQPLLGTDTAKTVSTILTFFLVGYLALASAPKGQSPPPWWSWLRLRSGLIFGGIGGLIAVGLDRLWP
jgi:peptidoglycan/LPS O-acetylase OafA/YrhL